MIFHRLSGFAGMQWRLAASGTCDTVSGDFPPTACAKALHQDSSSPSTAALCPCKSPPRNRPTTGTYAPPSLYQLVQPWLHILHGHRDAGRKIEFELASYHLTDEFGLKSIPWHDEAAAGGPASALELHPHILEYLVENWGRPECLDYLTDLLEDTDESPGFPLMVFEELLLLADVLEKGLRFCAPGKGASNSGPGKVLHTKLKDAREVGMERMKHRPPDAIQAERKMSGNYISWNAGLSVGIHEMDEQHKVFLGLLNRIWRGLVIHHALPDIEGVVFDLEDYGQNYFGAEEALMERQGYPELEAHQESHALFMSRMDEFSNRIAAGETIGLEMLNFLSDWLTFHHGTVDRHYADYLENQFSTPQAGGGFRSPPHRNSATSTKASTASPG